MLASFTPPQFKFWITLVELLSKYYSVKVAVSPEELEAVFKFRYQVYIDELNYSFLLKENHETKSLSDKYDFLANQIVLYAGDINNITGTFRLITWSRDEIPPEKLDKYHISKNLLNHFEKLGELTFFQVRKDYRRSFLSFALIGYLYKLTSLNAELSPDIVFFNTFPGLVKPYLSVGAFTYMQYMVPDPYGTLIIPLAFVPYDLHHLKKNRCITYGVARDYCASLKKNLSYDADMRRSRDISAEIPHVSLFAKKSDVMKYQSSLADENLRNQFSFIVSLIKEPMVISIKPNTIVIRKGMVDYDMFILLEGKLGVFYENLRIAEIKPGMIVGEMAHLSLHHERYNSIQSLTKAKLMFIPRNLLASLERKDPKVANKLLRMLSGNLIQKLSESNVALYEKLKPTGGSTLIKK